MLQKLQHRVLIIVDKVKKLVCLNLLVAHLTQSLILQHLFLVRYFLLLFKFCSCYRVFND